MPGSRPRPPLEERHGSIDEFIALHGYPAYARRNVETYEEIEARALAVLAISSGFMTYPDDVHPRLRTISAIDRNAVVDRCSTPIIGTWKRAWPRRCVDNERDPSRSTDRCPQSRLAGRPSRMIGTYVRAFDDPLVLSDSTRQRFDVAKTAARDRFSAMRSAQERVGFGRFKAQMWGLAAMSAPWSPSGADGHSIDRTARTSPLDASIMNRHSTLRGDAE